MDEDEEVGQDVEEDEMMERDQEEEEGVMEDQFEDAHEEYIDLAWEGRFHYLILNE